MKTNSNPVGWFAIYVQDMDRAKAFYEKTFEVKLDRLESLGKEYWTFPMKPEDPGCAGALVQMSGKDSIAGGAIVYFPGGDRSAVWRSVRRWPFAPSRTAGKCRPGKGPSANTVSSPTSWTPREI